MDQTDVSPLAAAMRETEEEIGLDRQFVDPIGYLDLRFAFSGPSPSTDIDAVWVLGRNRGDFVLIAGVGYGSLTEAVEPEKPPRVSKTHMNEPQGLA
jgi:8-oxo-dGTP pyrophosphatase MutT (NUDIX family)